MANTDAAFGLVPFGTTDGSDYHGKIREVEFVTGDSVACFLGDAVKLTGTTGTDGFTPVVAQAAAGNSIVGVIVGFSPDFENESFINAGSNRLASTSRKAQVCFGSDVLYVAQEDSDSGALVAADAGKNIDIVVAAGSTVTGVSGMELDSSSALQASGQFRLHHVQNKLDNELGANAQWVVSINENQDDHGAGVA